jgi:hypothetical protein
VNQSIVSNAIADSKKLTLRFNLSTPSFPYCQPGSKLPFVDLWFDGESVWLKLQHPQSSRIEAFRVAGAFSSNNAHFIVIEVSDAMSTDCSGIHVVLKLVNSDVAETVDFTEFQLVVNDARDRFITEDLQKKLGLESSDILDDHCVRELRRSLTHQLYFAQSGIPSGTDLFVESIWRYAEDVVVRLKAHGLDIEDEFRLPWLTSIGEQQYALITYQPELTSDDPVIPIVIVHVKNMHTLTTIDSNLAARLTRRCIKLVAGARRTSLAQIEGCFGAISERW